MAAAYPQPPSLFFFSLLTVIISVGVAEDPRPAGDFIHTLGATTWGYWGTTDQCSNGSFAYGFEVKVEDEHWALDDDTSINAIKLVCRTPEFVHTGEVTSATMNRGSWRGSHFCTSGFLNGYDLKSEAPESLGDNTAANALRMYCTGQGGYLEEPGNKWGTWLGPSYCRDGQAVCGIMTRVQEDQGTIGDDTALNDVRFFCCDL